MKHSRVPEQAMLAEQACKDIRGHLKIPCDDTWAIAYCMCQRPQKDNINGSRALPRVQVYRGTHYPRQGAATRDDDAMRLQAWRQQR